MRERAFSADHDEGVRSARIFIQAHQDEGVQCCIKHFPGHGSTMLDSHNDMCDITQTHTHDELRMFRSLIDSFGDSIAVMPGHLMDRNIDPQLPASLSPAHLDGVLRGTLGFDGPIISDSLDMRAIRDHFGEGESAVLALAAGCDIVLDGINAPGYRESLAPIRMVNAISNAVGSGRLSDGEAHLTASKVRLDRLFSR
ncbi:unnamed protein product [Laminaria digitata]